MEITYYFDYKSPYVYLVKDHVYELEDKYNANIQWRPYVLDLPAAFGDLETRTELQWRKVRYLYKDVRRFAALKHQPMAHRC